VEERTAVKKGWQSEEGKGRGKTKNSTAKLAEQKRPIMLKEHFFFQTGQPSFQRGKNKKMKGVESEGAAAECRPKLTCRLSVNFQVQEGRWTEVQAASRGKQPALVKQGKKSLGTKPREGKLFCNSGENRLPGHRPVDVLEKGRGEWGLSSKNQKKPFVGKDTR